MSQRQDHHFILHYQYRTVADNLGTLEEERLLSQRFGIQSAQYERWMYETLAMSFSIRKDDDTAKAAAAKHFIKMAIRKHGGRKNIRILEFSMDAEDGMAFYEDIVLPGLR